ncbi:MAG TPA: nucleotidyl transferase AbiEii/AbiGii toxin family protein, partial [Thermoanaerobaculia bacterium]|nr:nucleotidyl transferase AbiEii/AbiGii toxin family protein [Thermoanaerobaculia bacterium]
MTFVHDDPAFRDLLRITATSCALSPGLVEKDYWVTHALWALHAQGFEIWFKGGTSLSKGFGLIERFSEDLDLKVNPGTTQLPAITSWRSEGKTAVAQRRASFEALGTMLRIPGARVEIDSPPRDATWRNVELRVAYPGMFLADLRDILRPFVLLEIGNARVKPAVERDLTSFVHRELERIGRLAEYTDNRPRRVRCLHPLVTLLEKLDAISRRAPHGGADPAVFARHFEDAARIIQAADELPV